MPDASARLGLPHILPSQAQKHVTHNEAIEAMDALVHLTVESRGQTSPPVTPQPGQVWILGDTPTADWAGHGGEIARWDTSGWRFYPVLPGMRAWDVAAAEFVLFDGTGWLPIGGALTNLDGVGINAAWGPTNRLTVSSEATLLSHEGGSHQLKINKAAAPDTASLLFQSGWTGHAEMGLAGGSDFAVKVSPDGTAWTTAIGFDAATGVASGAAVQVDATDLTAAKLARVGATYGPGNILGTVAQSGGVPTGAVIESGQTADGRFIRFADGTQVCWADDFTVGAVAGTMLSGTWTYPAAFGAPPMVSLSLSLVAAHWTGIGREQVSCTGPTQAPGLTEVELGVCPVAGTGTLTATIAGAMPYAVGRWV